MGGREEGGEDGRIEGGCWDGWVGKMGGMEGGCWDG